MQGRLAAFMMLLFGSLAGAQTPPAALTKLAKDYHQVMIECPQRIWPGYDWKDLRVAMMTTHKSGPVWLWDATANRFQSRQRIEFSDKELSSVYSFFDFDGRQTMGLAIAPENEPFLLGVHEFFHVVGQRNWKISDAQRGQFYPVDWQPRYIRAMAFKRMKEWIVAPKSETKMNLARFWIDKWKRSYPEEVAATTDGYEGSACFVERAAAAVLKLGCAAPEKKLVQETYTQLDPNAKTGELSLDSEGYLLGGASFVALRMMDPTFSFLPDVVAGQTGLDLLLAKGRIEPDKDDAATLKSVKSLADETNAGYAKVMDPELLRLANPATVRVAIPHSYIQGDLELGFIVIPKVAPNWMALQTAAAHVFRSSDAGTSFTVGTNEIIWEENNLTGPCVGEETILVNRAALKETSPGHFAIKEKGRSGTVQGQMAKSADGLDYLCAAGPAVAKN